MITISLRGIKSRFSDPILGTGLFIGTGQALATGGPASILIAYILIGFVLFCTVQALGNTKSPESITC